MTIGVPTTVPGPELSAIVKVAASMTGGSFRFVTAMTTSMVADWVGVPSSVACTVSVNDGFVSKSTAAEAATAISPLEGSMANAPPVLPAMIE